MSRIARLLAVLGLLAMNLLTDSATLAQDDAAERGIDIATIPVPVDDLPETGFQVLAGGYLDVAAATEWVAGPRERSTVAIREELNASGWLQAYAMDLVLLEDRALATSDILAMVQTNIFLMPDVASAEYLYGILADYSGAGIDEEDAAIPDSLTVRLVSQSGDTLRTVFTHDRLVIEVVSLERFDLADAQAHRDVVVHTGDRAEQAVEAAANGIAPRAVRLVDGEDLASFQNVQQSGVHHLYRIRDGNVQPAAGEVSVPAAGDIAPGIAQVYHASEAMRLGGGTGTGFMSTWIGEFGSEGDALLFTERIVSDGPSVWLWDPYFSIARDEQATSQGVAGLYRVSGMFNGQPYSGNLEVRQYGIYVVAIGFRTLGSALTPVDVTSRVMDHQLACLEGDPGCPPLEVTELLAVPSATPIAPSGSESGGLLISEEFGWWVRTDAGEWVVTERYAESGYDFLELQWDRSLVTLESVIDHHGDAQQCVLDELGALQELESSAVIELGSDDPDEVPAGMEPGHAWAVYTVEPLAEERLDQEYTIRIDCYTIIEGGASLVVTHRAPRYEWEAEREKGSLIRRAIVLPSSSQHSGTIALRFPARAPAWGRAA